MNWIRGYYRLCLAALTVGLGGSLIILTSWIPLHIKGIRLSAWLVTAAARLLLLIFNVRVRCPEPEQVRQHQGFIFPNHLSYLDILVLLYLLPVRYVAKVEVRSWPLIGLIAWAIGCVFVKREDKDSRAQARATLAEAGSFPPIVLFPEGKRGPGDEILPFRYGAFEIAVQSGKPFLPCALTYDHLEIAIWRRRERILKALWRLASYAGPIQVRLTPLTAVHPLPGHDPIQLATETQAAITAVVWGR